jgi:hypothetical protein
MTERSMVRTTLHIDERMFLLAQGQDGVELRERIVQAVRRGGEFVEFVEVGNRLVFAFVTGRERILLILESVPFDVRDTGDVDFPYGGFFDEI